ncbi:MAG: hypothetical protein HZY76_04855 [Anaerolineae bacterium]|nr:MAG: hypothetical protein HZY76_04855 [Anaerolineae bacterium]
MQIIDVNNPAAPVVRGSHPATGFARDVFVSSNIAYVVNGYGNKLLLIDVRNPASPVQRGNYFASHATESVTVVEPYAYLGGPKRWHDHPRCQ